jgi:hypothetical protein
VPRCRLLVAVAVLAPLLAVADAQAAPAGRSGDPAVVAANATYSSSAVLCTVSTAHFKIWWDDRRRSADAPFGGDGDCRTLPWVVRAMSQRVEPIRAREMALGFPAAASDVGTGRNGGDGLFDVYLHRSTGNGETGRTWCMFSSVGNRVLRSWSNSVLATDYVSRNPDGLLRETIAHEYFHAIQCRIARRLDRLPGYVVEGTANWMAALVVPGALQITRASPLPNLLARLAEAAAATKPVTAQSYESWGFWYAATDGGRHPQRVRRILARLGTDGARGTVYAAVDRYADTHRSTLDMALAARDLAPLADVVIADSYRDYLGPVPLRANLSVTPASTGTVRLAPLGYHYVDVSWPGNTASVRVTVRVRAGLEQVLRRDLALVLAGGKVLRRPVVAGRGRLAFTIPAGGDAGAATLVLVNGRPVGTAFRVSAAR